MRVLESPRRTALMIVAVWIILTLLALLGRHVMAINETRYLSVAWEMWLRGDLLVPHLNGEPYHHKPPLLFWLINLSWRLFGVSEWAARLIPALIGVAGALLAMPLSALIWPAKPRLRSLAGWVLFSMLYWTIWSTAVMFDLLIAVCAEVALLGIILAWRGHRFPGWLIAGVGIGLGILAKGPVILVYVLPVMLLAPWWIREQRPHSWLAWYGGVAAAIALGATIGLSWALPAAAAGGEAYSSHLLWGQTADRVVNSFAHRRPLWWYLPMLPLLLFPWSLWPPLWRGIRQRWRQGWNSGERFALIGAGTGLGIFSLISGKQLHYLLPLFPLLALFSSQAMSEAEGHRVRLLSIVLPVVPLLLFGVALILVSTTDLMHGHVPWATQLTPWSGAIIVLLLILALPASRWLTTSLWPGFACLLFLGAVLPGSLSGITRNYELNGIATVINDMQRQGRSVAVFGKYHGEFNFVGRLEQPIETLRLPGFADWLVRHPDGVLVLNLDKQPSEDDAGMHYWQHYRSSYLVLRDAASWKPNRKEADF